MKGKKVTVEADLRSQKTSKLELENKFFQVDSKGWMEKTNRQDITYLENSEKDSWEYVAGIPDQLIGQQLCTFPAMIRETTKAGKRVPTDEQWNYFSKKDIIRNNLFPGFLYIDGLFKLLRSNSYFWSSSVFGVNAWIRILLNGSSTVNRNAADQAYGFTIWCLKN